MSIEIIENLNSLKAQKLQLLDFLEIIKVSNRVSLYSEKNKQKIDKLRSISIRADVWTGHDSVKRERELSSIIQEDLLHEIAKTIIPLLESEVKRIDAQISSLLR